MNICYRCWQHSDDLQLVDIGAFGLISFQLLCPKCREEIKLYEKMYTEIK